MNTIEKLIKSENLWEKKLDRIKKRADQLMKQTQKDAILQKELILTEAKKEAETLLKQHLKSAEEQSKEIQSDSRRAKLTYNLTEKEKEELATEILAKILPKLTE